MGVQTRKQNKIVVPLDFYLPPNSEGFVRIDLESGDRTDEESDDGGSDEIIDVTYDGPGSQTELSPPIFVTVVSQTLKTSANGQQTVDVLIEVEDVPGATDYDVRLTAA